MSIDTYQVEGVKMYKKITSQDINKIEIPNNQYNEIKKDYFTKKENKYCLYKKYHMKYNISKDNFLELLEKLKSEFNPIKKQSKCRIKRKNNQYSFYDKHPLSYKIEGIYHNGYKTSEFQKIKRKFN
jgi:hypothetical protein